MTHSDQIRDDLSFVRQAVARRDGMPPAMSTSYYVWAAYVLVGYCLLDVNPRWANWFFLLAWFPCVVACGIARRWWPVNAGVSDTMMSKRAKQHFLFGSLLAVGAVIGLACCAPSFRGPITGQVIVILFGVIYFLAGIHFDRSFLWLGPVLVLGGIIVGFVPHYGWSALGVVISGGLCVVGILNSRRLRAGTSSEPA